jgi:hypothetical protein
VRWDPTTVCGMLRIRSIAELPCSAALGPCLRSRACVQSDDTHRRQNGPPVRGARPHLVSLGLVAIAIIMLIAPASYHRIAAHGNAEEGVLRCAVAMMLPAEGLIALGLVGDAYVTVRMISESHTLALWLGIFAALGFMALLYGYPLASRYSRS